MTPILSITLPVLLLSLLANEAMAKVPDAQRLKEAFCPYSKLQAQRLFRDGYFTAEIVGPLTGELEKFDRRFGSCEGVVSIPGAGLALLYSGVKVPIQPILDKRARLIDLHFSPPLYENDSLQSVAKALDRIATKNSLFIVKNNSDASYAKNQEQKLSISNSYLIFLLKEYRSQQRSGLIKDDQQVSLKNSDKNSRYGITVDWPEGTRLTSGTLAALSILHNDSTAADLLVRMLGMDVHTKLGGWFYSTMELCDSLFSLKEDPLAQGGPGIADRERWDKIVHSDALGADAVQFTYLVRRKAPESDWYCVSMTVNAEKKLDQEWISELMRRTLRLLEK